jgi:hypothetical protein
MGFFSRVAQATYLLSQALKAVSLAANDQDSAAQADETEQLRRTLLALVHLSDAEATRSCPLIRRRGYHPAT